VKGWQFTKWHCCEATSPAPFGPPFPSWAGFDYYSASAAPLPRHCQTPSPEPEEAAMSESIIHITDDSFDREVLQSDTPVLVDYWAEWCGPCKMIAPALDELAKEYSGRLKVAKINIDENSKITSRFGIRGIPTLMLFKNGNVEASKVGALSKSQLSQFIDTNI
jgi:thioredoxin 1